MCLQVRDRVRHGTDRGGDRDDAGASTFEMQPVSNVPASLNSVLLRGGRNRGIQDVRMTVVSVLSSITSRIAPPPRSHPGVTLVTSRSNIILLQPSHRD